MADQSDFPKINTFPSQIESGIPLDLLSGSNRSLTKNTHSPPPYPDELSIPSQLSSPSTMCYRNCTKDSSLSPLGRQYSRRNRLCRNKSFSSSALPTISIMVEEESNHRSSIESRRMSCTDAENPPLPFVKVNSLAETQCTYLSHPNLTSDTTQGLYSRRDINDEDTLQIPDDIKVPENPSPGIRFRSSFMSLFKRR